MIESPQLRRRDGGLSLSSYDESAIMELLASRSAPEQVLAICPSPEPQARVNELLQQSKANWPAAKKPSLSGI